MKRHFGNRTFAHRLLLVALAANLALPSPSQADWVALTTAPLATSTTSAVKPNILFMLDDSGSMNWDFLPDWADGGFCKDTAGTYTLDCCGSTGAAGSGKGANAAADACWGGTVSDTAPFTTYRGHPPFLNNDFNGVYYNPAVTYSPPVLYNADGTLNTTTYPNMASPWTSVKNDAYNIQNTKSINLVSGFPDLEWCTDGTFSNCLRNDNYVLPGSIGGVNYKTYHATVATGSGNLATGEPNAATTAARSWGPHYYTIAPGEYCDSSSLKNCQTTQTATYSFPAKLRWCNSTALTTCQALNSSTFKYPRYPTTFFTPAVPYSAAVPAVPAVIGVTGVEASASFSFTFSGSLNPVGFTIKVNGTEILTATTPAALQTSSQLATWVIGHSSLSGYNITASGSTVTIKATATGTAKNINSIVIAETPPVSVTFTTNPASVSGKDAVAGAAPSNGTLVISNATRNQSASLKCGATFVGKSAAFNVANSGTLATRLDGVFTNITAGQPVNGYTTSCVKNLTAGVTSSLSCTITAPVAASACSGGFTLANITATTNTGPSGGVTAAAAVKAAGTITFTNATSLNPTGFSVKVNGTEIMSATTPGALSSSTAMATWVKANSSLSGFTITNSSSTVTLTANTAGTAGNISTIAIVQNAPSTATASAPTYIAGVDAVAASPFIPAKAEVLAQPAVYPGSFMRTDIVPGNDSYPYPGTTTKASTRTDCVADTTDPKTCTYAEEMTNFANWWTYYHSRMQSMKSSVSRAFKTLDNRYRVGFSTINTGSNSNPTDATFLSNILNNDIFELTHKKAWFTKLFAQTPAPSTPLRGALSKAGRYYAKKIASQTIDPVQYSCQQNFTILSTDGYWNDAASVALDLAGGTVGNLDGGSTARPMYEGPTASSGSLADVAKYYYDSDLRTTALGNCAGGISTDFPSGNPDVCTNNVFISSTDKNLKQHMTTFTMGLGADGTLNFTTDYLTATSGDYYNIKNGLGSPTVNWPDPQVGSPTTTGPYRIDDLWHAAVNGQGIYFSAKDPDQIVAGFNSALSSISAKLGSAAAAATSTLNPVAGNNFAYVASYTTVKWKGNLESRSINTVTGVVSENANWCVENVVAGTCASPGTVVADTSGSSTVYNCVVAGATAGTCTAPGIFDSGTSQCRTEIANLCVGTMAAKVGATTDSRTIYTANSTRTALVPFNAAYAAANPTNFAAAHINTLNQWGLLDATQRTAAEGVNLINYLRGQNGFEDRAANAVANRLYRAREAVLGDALESQPAFIAAPVFNYPYAGYSDYKTAQASRAGTVYMGANDGMMHAFDAGNGTERWAYVPSMVVPELWKLASTNYDTNHYNFVNGSPVTSDVYCPANCGGATNGAVSASWRTILVAGLNGGGRGYFALDITDPVTPVLLWEFTPANDSALGYSFGQPIITRKVDGTWVVLVTSGYDNGTVSDDVTLGSSPVTYVANSPAGDGRGYLYVLDATTGAIISKISTGVGTPAAPSGLAKIAGWNDEPVGNKVGYVYGGDLLGNVWRFDVNSAVAATFGTGEVMKFATLFSDAAGASAQPITTTPVLGKILEKRVIFIGTGKYLETGDLSTTQIQTQYAIKDDNATTTLVNPRTTLVNQTLTNDPLGTATRFASANAVNFLTGRGWYVDFPDSKERVNIDSKLVEGTLLVPSIVPSSTVCSPGGYGWLNFFDYLTGGAVIKTTATTGLASVKYDSTIVGVNVIYIGNKPIVEIVTSTNPTPEKDPNVVFKPTTTGFTGKRVTWRELIP